MGATWESAFSRDDASLKRAVYAWGSPDTSPIVLLHGFMQDGGCWADVAEGLARGHYVVAPTMTVEREEDATLDGLAVVAFEAAQQAMRRTGHHVVTVLGYSMGGRVALAYARRFPTTLRALVLESTGLGPEDDGARAQGRVRNEVLAERLESDESMDSLVDYWEALPIFESQKSIDCVLRAKQRKHRMACDRHQLAWVARHAGMHTMPPAAEARAMLAQMEAPVLYIAGKKDTKYCGIAKTLEGSVAAVEYLECGHNTHLEAPVGFVRCVTDFLDGTGIGGNIQ